MTDNQSHIYPLAGGPSGENSGKNPRPNILLLCVDDMAPLLGCFHDLPFCHPRAITPNLDRLATQGTAFSHAHCPAPLCNPARTAILTGMHPTSSGVYGNYCWWRPNLPDVKTLPEIFRENGYLVAGAGKIFHHCSGFNPPNQWDDYQDQIFDDTWDRLSSVNYPQITPDHPPPGHPLHGLDYFVHEFDWGSLPIAEDDYGDAQAVGYAERFLQGDYDRPFFLACGLFHPHLPWYAPQRFFDLNDSAALHAFNDGKRIDWNSIPSKGRQLASVGPQNQDQLGVLIRRQKLPQAIQAYLASISFADYLIGRVLSALDSSRYANDTMVVFYGDHGFHVGARRHFGKMTLWRESTQVPLLMKGPGIPAGQRIAAAVSTLDIMATLAEWCDFPPITERDSCSLGPLVRGEVTTSRPVLCSLDARNHAVITSEHRYIAYEDGGEELYDLKDDPDENKNLCVTNTSDAIRSTLRSVIPRQPAPEALGLDAFDFDLKKYRWERR